MALFDAALRRAEDNRLTGSCKLFCPASVAAPTA